MRILIFDNYDSFTYNLVQLVEQWGAADYEVVKSDKVTLEMARNFDKILFSPGPGLPADVPMMIEIIRELGPEVPMLGVCLGHQAIAVAFGGELVNLEHIYHGMTIDVQREVDDEPLFFRVPAIFRCGLYHSWAVADEGFPAVLEITARGEFGTIMALRHRTYPLQGIQFHPESIMTPNGRQMIFNWLEC